MIWSQPWWFGVVVQPVWGFYFDLTDHNRPTVLHVDGLDSLNILRHTIPSLLSGSLRPAAENANRHCDALRVIGKIWKYPPGISSMAGKSSISRWLSDYPSNSWMILHLLQGFLCDSCATGLALVLWSSDASATPMPGRSRWIWWSDGSDGWVFSAVLASLFRGRGALQEYRFSGVRQLSCWMLHKALSNQWLRRIRATQKWLRYASLYREYDFIFVVTAWVQEAEAASVPSNEVMLKTFLPTPASNRSTGDVFKHLAKAWRTLIALPTRCNRGDNGQGDLLAGQLMMEEGRGVHGSNIFNIPQHRAVPAQLWFRVWAP